MQLEASSAGGHVHEPGLDDDHDEAGPQAESDPIRFDQDAILAQVKAGTLTLEIGSPNSSAITKIKQGLAEAGHLAVAEVSSVFDAATKTAVEAFQTSKGLTVNGKVDSATLLALEAVFNNDYQVERDILAGKTAANLDEGTRALTDEDRAAVSEALSTETRADPVTGLDPTFVPTIAAGNYYDRVKDTTERILLLQWERLGKGKEADHADPAKLHDWSAIGNLAQESKKATDNTFGTYKVGPALEPNVNIMDGWEDKERQMGVSSAAKDQAANWRVQKIIEGDPAVLAIDVEHGAKQSRAAEKTILDRIKAELVAAHYDKLIETHKGWPGYASGGKIFLQRFKSPDDAKNRDFMWRNYRTIIHEYIHTLEHADHIAYRGGMDEKLGGKSLREGTTDYFTKIAWSKINLGDATLRQAVEGPYHDPAVTHPIPPMGAYGEAVNVERMAAIVGFNNVASAFFLGKTELIGKV